MRTSVHDRRAAACARSPASGCDDRSRPDDGRAARRPQALFERRAPSATSSSRASSSTRRSSPTRPTSKPIRATCARDERIAPRRGVDVLFAPAAEELYPPGFATWVEPSGAARASRASAAPGHFRGVATVCVKLFAIVRPDVAYFGRKDAQQVAVVKQVVRDLNLDGRDPRRADGPRRRRARPLVPQRAALGRRARAVRSRSRARSRRATPTRARAVLAEAGIEPEYVAVADLDGPTLAVAARVGSTRLIDNVLLEGDPR